MKTSISLVVLLAIVSVSLAEPVPYNTRGIARQLYKLLGEGNQFLGQRVSDYLKMATQTGGDKVKAAKLNLAAQLFRSLESIRYMSIHRAIERELYGDDLEREMKKVLAANIEANLQADSRLESLIKLGQELSDAQILEDVSKTVVLYNDTALKIVSLVNENKSKAQ